MLPVFLVDDDQVHEDRIVVGHPEVGQQPERIADHIRGIQEDGLWAGITTRLRKCSCQAISLKLGYCLTGSPIHA